MQDEITQIFQQVAGRVISVLYSHIRDLELVEDVVQDAFVVAIERWPHDGLPDNPAGWITVVARRKALDRLRRDKTLTHKLATLQALEEHANEDMTMNFDTIPDERLKLMFTCCHPALAKEAQIALTLRTLGGLTTEDIAKAFLVPVPTMAQRLVRAKRKIRDAGIPFHIPSLDTISDRVDSVLSVLYLIFNAGYTAPTGDALIRHGLCAEATRLTRILRELLRKEQQAAFEPEVMGLLALMLLHDSRSVARVDGDGYLVPLEEQDRSLWDAHKIAEGTQLLEQALQMRQAGPYQIQAAISAVHAQSPQAEDTDWPQIVVLYNLLYRMTPSPIIALNRIVAIAMVKGVAEGLQLLNELEAESYLGEYYLLHAARADFLRRSEQWHAAAASYRSALALCDNETERNYLQHRLDDMMTRGNTTQPKQNDKG